MGVYQNRVFAPLDQDHQVVRYAGGNESEVYLSDSRDYVYKIKGDLAGKLEEALWWAQAMREAAQMFIECLGPKYTIPSYYALSEDNEGHAQILLVQPFVDEAHPLFAVDYGRLSSSERRQVAKQLRKIIGRSVRYFFRHGQMPDLYGRTATSPEERDRRRGHDMIFVRVWSFLVERPLLRSHNLLLTDAPDCRIVLVDYDPVRRSTLYRTVYYLTRLLLFIRDLMLIWWMEKTGYAPGGQERG